MLVGVTFSAAVRMLQSFRSSPQYLHLLGTGANICLKYLKMHVFMQSCQDFIENHQKATSKCVASIDRQPDILALETPICATATGWAGDKGR